MFNALSEKTNKHERHGRWKEYQVLKNCLLHLVQYDIALRVNVNDVFCTVGGKIIHVHHLVPVYRKEKRLKETYFEIKRHCLCFRVVGYFFLIVFDICIIYLQVSILETAIIIHTSNSCKKIKM